MLSNIAFLLLIKINKYLHVHAGSRGSSRPAELDKIRHFPVNNHGLLINSFTRLFTILFDNEININLIIGN